MNGQDNGGPAFPQLDCYVDAKGEKPAYTTHDGMTLRDYFAARAPQRPLWHFDPAMPPRPEEFSYKGGARTQEELNDNARAIIEWEKARDTQTLVQWPWVWADAMLKARSAK
jgi:hypothetical protein